MSVIAWAIVCAVAVGLAAAFYTMPRAALSTHIEIAASPEQVWAVLGDPPGYARWNPFIVSMQGQLVEGQTLVNELQQANGKRLRISPTVRKVVAGRELRWQGRLLLPGLFDGEHYVLLSPSADGASTQVSHGENFNGLLLWLLDVERFRPDFERMNQALKATVEQMATRRAP